MTLAQRAVEDPFRTAIAAAILLHMLGLVIYAFEMWHDSVEVPYKYLKVRLGKVPNASISPAMQNRQAERQAAKPVIKTPVVQPKEPLPTPRSMMPPRPASMPVAATVPTQSTAKIKETEAPKPSETTKAKGASPGKVDLERLKRAPVVVHKVPPAKPTIPLSQQARQNTPTQTAHQDIPLVQHYRSDEKPVQYGVSGNLLGNRSDAEQTVIQSYEQKLALWLEKHRVYPLSAQRQKLTGKGVVRLQVDRLGNVRYYDVAESTGFDILDWAIKDMARRSDPVPPLPPDYPGGYVVEFQLPVNFKLLGAP